MKGSIGKKGAEGKDIMYNRVGDEQKGISGFVSFEWAAPGCVWVCVILAQWKSKWVTASPTDECSVNEQRLYTPMLYSTDFFFAHFSLILSVYHNFTICSYIFLT